MAPEEKEHKPTETLWNIIGRFDGLTESTNSKAALIIAFNTFVLGGILLEWKDILPSFTDQRCWAIVCGLFLLAAALASVVSLRFTVKAIKPFTKTHTEVKSVIFFKDISDLKPAEYHDKITKISPDDLEKDLAFQAHILSTALNEKFQHLKTATCYIQKFQLPALGIFALLRLPAFLCA